MKPTASRRRLGFGPVSFGIRWLYLLAGVVAYALTGFLLVPFIAERTLGEMLEERAGLQTSIGSLGFNPFTFTLELEALTVTEPDGGPLFGFDGLLVNFELASLFRWAWTFDEVHLTAPRFDFERVSETENNVGRLIDAWTASGDTSGASQADGATGGLTRLAIADLRIERGAVTITDRIRRETFTTKLAPIDLSVENFSTLPEASGAQQVTITTESGATLSWSGTLSVNPLAVAGRVSMEGIYTPLVFRYFRDELALPLAFEGGDLDLTLSYTFSLDDTGQLSAVARDLAGTLTGLAVIRPDGASLVRMDSVSLTGGRLSWPDKAAHISEVELNGVSINAERDAEGHYLAGAAETNARSEPAPPAANPIAEPTAEPWQLSVGRIHLRDWRISHSDAAFGSEPVVVADLDVTIRDLSNRSDALMPFELAAMPALGGRVQAGGELRVLPEPTVTASISLGELPLAVGQPYLDSFANIIIRSGTVSLSGDLQSNAETPFRYAGDFRVDDVELVDRALEQTLFSFQHLSADRLELAPERLAISTLEVASPFARIGIEQDGTNNIQKTLVARGPEPSADSATEATSAPFAVTIGETSVAGGSARFTDLSLPLPFEANVTDLGGRISTLSSSSDTPARVALEGQVNEYGHLAINGTLQPFAPTVGTDMIVAFENVDLPSLSPYTIKFAGRKIDDGRTDLDLTVRIAQDRFEGDNHLVIRDLKLGDRVPHPDAMDLPLDLAVALLKDPSGTVDFSFPVSGSLGDPDFSYGGAVAKAFSNLILGLATSPFRLLGSLVGLQSAEMETVAFRSGRADLTPPRREVLDRLATALAQRPQLALEVTPVLDPAADRRALQEAAIDQAVAERLDAMTAGDAVETMLDERRRRVLESLYDERDLTPARSDVRQAHTRTTDDGARALDSLAYAEAIRAALIDTVTVPREAMTALAERRVEAVTNQLITRGGLRADRLRTADVEERPADAEGMVHMPLDVITGG